MAQQTHANQSNVRTLEYLGKRVREEAVAAATAGSAEATLMHVFLATAYAKRFGECSPLRRSVADVFADEHRIW